MARWGVGSRTVSLFLVFLDDAYFYFFHRLLHVNPYLYKRFIKFITEHLPPFHSSTSTSILWSGCLVLSRFQLDLAVSFSPMVQSPFTHLGLCILAKFPRNRYSLWASFVSRNVDSVLRNNRAPRSAPYEKDPRKLCLDIHHLGSGSQNLHSTDLLSSK